jgi:hypothetical protein
MKRGTVLESGNLERQLPFSRPDRRSKFKTEAQFPETIRTLSNKPPYVGAHPSMIEAARFPRFRIRAMPKMCDLARTRSAGKKDGRCTLRADTIDPRGFLRRRRNQLSSNAVVGRIHKFNGELGFNAQKSPNNSMGLSRTVGELVQVLSQEAGGHLHL